jgi:hypothetical protein
MGHQVYMRPDDPSNAVWRMTVEKTGVGGWSRQFYMTFLDGGSGDGPDDTFMSDMADAIGGMTDVNTTIYKLLVDYTAL